MKTVDPGAFMLRFRRLGCAAAVLFVAVLLYVPSGRGQASPSVNNGSQLPRRIPVPSEMDDRTDTPGTALFYERRLRMLNAAQHNSMVADTDKLVKLVAELNAEVSSSNSKSLTPQQLHMVAEIEKLAHNIRDKMRMSVRSSMYGDMGPPLFAPR